MSSVSSGDERDVNEMSFEELRKKARQMEQEIETKMVSFSKLVSNANTFNVNQETVSLLSADSIYETIVMELEHLLLSLTDINERMNKMSNVSSTASIHIIQRHRDILQDYVHEFQRISTNVRSKRDRDELLSTNGKAFPAGGLSHRDLFLKESDHLANSEHLIDEQISIAIETREAMKNQRDTFKMIQSKVNDLSSRFPLINSLMNKINIRKRRDALIIGCVIGLGFTFLIWWIFL